MSTVATGPAKDLPKVGLSKTCGDVPKNRPCLRCHAKFWSAGFGDRICRRCKNSRSWRIGITTTYGRAGRT